jgi:predicted deacylase
MLSIGELRGAQEPLMARSQSRLTAEIDFNRNGKQHGFIRLPYSVHRSAYGWIPIPVACIKNDAGPRILLMAGNHGDEYEGQVALGKLIRDLEPDEVSGRATEITVWELLYKRACGASFALCFTHRHRFSSRC